MPINVEHDNDQNSQIALSLLTALLQPQQNQIPAPQQPAPNSTADLLSQLAPLTAARANGSAPQNPYAVNGDASAPSYQSRPSRRVPSYASYDGLYGGGSSGSSNNDAKYANQDELAQYRAQQSDQRLHERDQQQSDMEVQRQLAEPEHDIPQYIQEGLNSGRYKYDPANRRNRQEAQGAITKVLNDPSWSPAQRTQFIAARKNEIRQYDMSVMDVPPNERPVSPQAQAQQTSWPEVHQPSGLTLTYYPPPIRNGAASGAPVLDPKSAADLKDWEKEQDHKREMEKLAAQNTAKAQAEANKPPKETPQQRADREYRHAEMVSTLSELKSAHQLGTQSLEEAQAKRLDAQKAYNSRKDESNADTLHAAFEDAYDAETKAHQKLRDIEQKQADYAVKAKQVSEQAAEQQATVAQPDFSQSGQLPPDQTIEQPAAQQALPVSSPDDLRQQIRSGQLQSGDTVMTPSGPHQLTDDDISGA